MPLRLALLAPRIVVSFQQADADHLGLDFAVTPCALVFEEGYFGVDASFFTQHL